MGRLILDFKWLWLLRRRRCSFAAGERNATNAQTPAMPIPISHKTIQPRCDILVHFDSEAPSVKTDLGSDLVNPWKIGEPGRWSIGVAERWKTQHSNALSLRFGIRPICVAQMSGSRVPCSCGGTPPELAGKTLALRHKNLIRERHRIARKTCFFVVAQYTVDMKNDVVPVQIRGILPATSGCALFVGNDEKVFVINVEPNMGAIIGMFLRDTPKERPLTHDLMQSVFKGFSITVERVIITELRNSTYFARLILQQQNELARKIVEVDARPSDCLALATAQKRPIYVASALFEQVEDMSEVLDRINENGGELE